MVNCEGSLLGIAVVLLSATLVVAAPKGILSVGPEDADTSFILDSRGGVETFQGALPNEDLLRRHEILKEEFKTSLTPGSEYQIAYEVHAPSTGDGKSFLENRYEDGTVTGQYSIMNPDGSHRIVTYSASPEAGFKASFGKKIVDDALEPTITIVDDLEPAAIIAEPEYNPDRLGFFDDSDEQISSRNFNLDLEGYESDTQNPSYYAGFRSGLYNPAEQENFLFNLDLKGNPSYYGEFRTGLSRPRPTEQENFIDVNTMIDDGQFGAKLAPNTQLSGYQYQTQNKENHEFSAHIQESTRKWPFSSPNVAQEQYTTHNQDNSNPQLHQNNLKQSNFAAQFTNTVQNQPSFQLIPVSIQKFSFDDMLQKYNVEHEYKWLEKRKVPFTVMPAFIRRFD